MPYTLETLIARQEIADVICRYARDRGTGGVWGRHAPDAVLIWISSPKPATGG